MTVRIRYIISALAALIVLIAGSISWPAAQLPFTQQLIRNVEQATGFDVSIGRVSLRLMPWPHLKVSDVSLSSAQMLATDNSATRAAALLNTREVRIDLALWPLLRGHAKLVNITVINPRIRWFGPEQPHLIWSLAQEYFSTLVASYNIPHQLSVSAHSRLLALAKILPTRLTINDGMIVYRNGSRRLVQRLNSVIYWPSTDGALTLKASALWRGEIVDLRIEKLQPLSLIAGRASPLSAQLSAHPAEFSFSGSISSSAISKLEGDISFRTRSLRQTVAWLRIPIAFANNLGSLAIKSPIDISDNGLSLPNARIDTAGGMLEGALATRITNAGRLLISATLDANTLDLNHLFAPPYAANSSWHAGTASEWSRVPFISRSGNADFSDNDLDIRLSIAKALVGPVIFSDVAAGILLVGGRFEIALNQANLDDGLLKGRMQLVPERDHLQANLTGSFDGIDAQRMLNSLTDTSILSGNAKGQIALSSTGGSPNTIARNLAGMISVHIADGELSNVDLESVVQRMREKPLATALDWRGGRTPFSTIDASLQIKQGQGILKGEMHTKNRHYGMITGVVDIADKMLALRALAMASKPDDGVDTTINEADNKSPKAFPVEITGAWNYPTIIPDISSLIGRSDAALPFILPDAHTSTQMKMP